MSTNEGILAGRIWGESSQKPYAGALITLYEVIAEATIGRFILYDKNGLITHQPQVYSDEDGYFVIPFCWDDTKLGFLVGGNYTPFRAAVTNVDTNGYKQGKRYTYRSNLHLCVSLRRIADGTGKIPEINTNGGIQVAQEIYQGLRKIKIPSFGVTVMRFSSQYYSLLAWKEWMVPE